MKRMKTLVIAGILLCLMAAGPALAEGIHTEIPCSTLEVEAVPGYDGIITYGKMIPVRVTIRNHGADLDGTLAVNGYVDAMKYDRYVTAVNIPAGGERTVVLPVKTMMRQEVFTAEILQDGKVLCAVNAQPSGTINPSAMLIGVISTRPRQLANLDINQENDSLYRYEYWQTVPLTPETLPDNPVLLKSFGMIVLDDTDPALLTEKQRTALQDWVRSGRVLLCGGGAAAPRNLAFLGEATALKAEDFTVSTGVLAALESYAGQGNSGRKPEVALAKITGGEPFVLDADGNGLIWQETAGRGRIYILAWEAGEKALNTESLMHSFYQQMLVKTDPTLYSSILYNTDNTYYSATYYPGNTSDIEAGSPLIPALLLTAGAAVLGCLIWFLLKKNGKTQLMWAVLPALAAAAGISVFLISGSSALNSPAAAVATNRVQTADGVTTCYLGISAAAPSTGLHAYAMGEEELIPNLYDSTWYGDEEEDDKPKIPAKIRLSRSYGEGEKISMNAETPWEPVSLSAVYREKGEDRIEAEIWMENDGLHGTVRNATGSPLKEGTVITSYGFVRVKALQPGESTDFALAAEEAQDPANPQYTDGKMLTNAMSGLYTVVYAAYGMDTDGGATDPRTEMRCSLVNGAAEQINQSGEKGGTGMERASFFYTVELVEQQAPEITIDGKKPELMAAETCLTAEIRYLTVGRTGVVFHTPGTDIPVRCELDETDMPAGEMDRNEYNVYSNPLSETPTFRFSLGDTSNVNISKLMIGMDSWYASQARCFLLNAYLHTWEEIDMNEAVKNPALYLDRSGNLYCQFRPSGNESYAEVPVPSLTLEGRLKDAEP